MHLGRALLAAGVALALQIGVNFANDYSDGIRGTDSHRTGFDAEQAGAGLAGAAARPTGPARLTASGLVEPKLVRNVAFGAFGVAGVLGLALVALTGLWWLLAVGAAAVVAAWFYTGGKHPYGYAGLGEVFVFLFFGLVATLGTAYVQAGRLTLAAWLGAVGIGLLACAILMVNNIRDIPTDRLAGKNTLASRLGDVTARRAYLGMVFSALIVGLVTVLTPVLGLAPAQLATSATGHPAVAVAVPAVLAIGVLVALALVELARPIRAGATGAALIPVLAKTARLELYYAAVLALGFTLN